MAIFSFQYDFMRKIQNWLCITLLVILLKIQVTLQGTIIIIFTRTIHRDHHSLSTELWYSSQPSLHLPADINCRNWTINICTARSFRKIQFKHCFKFASQEYPHLNNNWTDLIQFLTWLIKQPRRAQSSPNLVMSSYPVTAPAAASELASEVTAACSASLRVQPRSLSEAELWKMVLLLLHIISIYKPLDNDLIKVKNSRMFEITIRN